MEIVENSARETLRRVESLIAGGVITRYSTRHLRIHPNPLFLAFVRMTGMNLPWGLAIGRAQDAKPKILCAVDPRQPEQLDRLVADLAQILLDYFGITGYSANPHGLHQIAPEDMPQLWVPDSSNLEMIHNLAFKYYKPLNGESKSSLEVFGRLSGFLFEHSNIVGHQLVVNATELMNNLYVAPTSDYFTSRLSSINSWINSNKNLNEKRIEAIEAASVETSVTLNPIEEQNFPGAASLKDGRPIPSASSEGVKQMLSKELTSRWNYLKQAWDISLQDLRPENSQIPTFVQDSLKSFTEEFIASESQDEDEVTDKSRHPETDKNSVTSSLFYLKAVEAEDKFISHMVHDDPELLSDLFFSGLAFIGKIIDVKTETDGKVTWKAQLSPKFGKLLKRRLGETYCVIGSPDNPSCEVTGFSQSIQNVEGTDTSVWEVELRFEKKNDFPNINENYQKFVIPMETNDSNNWKGCSAIFVPSFAKFLHDKAQRAVELSIRRPGSWLISAGETNE